MIFQRGGGGVRTLFSPLGPPMDALTDKFNVGLTTRLQEGISEPVSYGDLVKSFKNIVGKPHFPDTL